MLLPGEIERLNQYGLLGIKQKKRNLRPNLTANLFRHDSKFSYFTIVPNIKIQTQA